MDLAAISHRNLTPQEALQEFALLRYFDPAYLAQALARCKHIVVFDQTSGLQQADLQDWLHQQAFIIIQGDLHLEAGLNLAGVNSELTCLLILGDFYARHLHTGRCALTVLGKLELQRYLHISQQTEERIELRISQRLLVPVLLQETTGVKLAAGEFICPYRYHADDGLGFWPERYFSDKSRERIVDCEGLVTHILSEVQKPPELQSNFDWISHYDFNPKRFPEAESLLLSNSPPANRGQLLRQAEVESERISFHRIHSIEFSELYSEYLPAWLSDCRNLQQIKLDNCFSYLRELPDLAALPHLRCLEINGSNPDLQRHPVCATTFVQALMQMNLSSLEYLSINFWNATPGIFANAQHNGRAALSADDLRGIAKFQRLKVINFYGNGLTDLPEEFYRLSQLRYIRILDQLSSACQQRIKTHFSHQAELMLA